MQLGEEKNLEKLKPWILTGICLFTFLCFINTLHNQFTNWDDNYYIALNPYVKAFTRANLKVIFAQNITLNYYHPFTILSIMVNYHLSQMSPMAYYLTNILLHISNVSLVFILANAIFNKVDYVDKKGALFISSLSALWFGIHPMHVESVSWIAERKDVLYTFFYLLGLISYVKYIAVSNWKWYTIMVLLFVSSCLSKPMAVVFPLSLFCIDILLKRKWDRNNIIEKVPLLLISLLFGLISFHFQQQSNSITSFGNIPLTKRLMFASYGFVMYIAKFFAPVHLSTFYPYPCINMELHVDMPLPLFYYFSFWIALLIIAIPLFLTYKTNRNYFRLALFGLGFFLVNVVFELQFISSGMAIMADRYSYVSYIGLLFVSTFFLQEILNRFPVFKIFTVTIVIAYTVLLSYLCFKRTEVWLTPESLFKDAVEQYGDQASLFYKALGEYYSDNKKPEQALDYYARYARLNNDAEVLNEMGNLYKSLKDYPDAAKYYGRLLYAGASASTTFIKISDAWTTMGQNDSAVAYYRKAVIVNPDMEKLYANIGTACINAQQFQNAINHYNVLITLNPENPYYYFYRGVAKFNLGELNEAMNDFLIPVKLAPNDAVPGAAYNLSVIYDKLGNGQEAYKYAEMARNAGQKIDTAFFNSLERKGNIRPGKIKI
jgi:protein O-mannosyl-transferase